MHVMTNELSFVAQAKSFADADNLMKVFLQVIIELQKTYKDEKLSLYRHSSFANRELSPEYTVRACAKAKSFMDQQHRRFLLELITKGPYIDKLLDDKFAYHDCLCNGQNIAGSSLAGVALLGLADSILVSLQSEPTFVHACIRVQVSPNGTTFTDHDVCNLTMLQQVKTLCRPYELTDKHKSLYGWGTPMDLSDDIAQEVLHKGIKPPDKKQIYGYYNGRFYEFQPDGTGQCPGQPDTYHGYPVPETQVHPSVVQEMKKRGLYP